MSRFVAQWPIENEDLPASALRAEALGDLTGLLQRHRAELTGEPAWTLSEHAGITFLNLSAPARATGGR